MSCLLWFLRHKVPSIDSDSDSESHGEMKRKMKKTKTAKQRRLWKWKLPWRKNRDLDKNTNQEPLPQPVKEEHEVQTEVLDLPTPESSSTEELQEERQNPMKTLMDEDEEKREQLLTKHVVTAESDNESIKRLTEILLDDTESIGTTPDAERLTRKMSDEAEDDVITQLMLISIEDEFDNEPLDTEAKRKKMSDEAEDIMEQLMLINSEDMNDQQIVAELLFDLIDNIESVNNQPIGIQMVTDEDETDNEDEVIDFEESELPELHPLGDNAETDDSVHFFETETMAMDSIMAALAIKTLLNICVEDTETDTGVDLVENPLEPFNIFKGLMSEFLSEVESSTTESFGEDLPDMMNEDSDAEASGQLLPLLQDDDQSLECEKKMTKMMLAAVTMKAVMNIFMEDDYEEDSKIDSEEDNKEDTERDDEEELETEIDVHTEDEAEKEMETEIDIEEDKKEDTERDNEEELETEIDVHTKDETEKEMETEIDKQEDTERDNEEDIKIDTERDVEEDVKIDTEVDIDSVIEEDTFNVDIDNVTEEDGRTEKDIEKAPEIDSVEMLLEQKDVVNDTTPVEGTKTRPRRKRGTRGKGRKINYKKDKDGLTADKAVTTSKAAAEPAGTQGPHGQQRNQTGQQYQRVPHWWQHDDRHYKRGQVYWNKEYREHHWNHNKQREHYWNQYSRTSEPQGFYRENRERMAWRPREPQWRHY